MTAGGRGRRRRRGERERRQEDTKVIGTSEISCAQYGDETGNREGRPVAYDVSVYWDVLCSQCELQIIR